jgi:hypothetical protein
MEPNVRIERRVAAPHPADSWRRGDFMEIEFCDQKGLACIVASGSSDNLGYTIVDVEKGTWWVRGKDPDDVVDNLSRLGGIQSIQRVTLVDIKYTVEGE